MLIVTRFKVPAQDAEAFRAGLEQAHAALAAQSGYVEGRIGRNVDDPELWVLQTVWEGPGAYRRALSSLEVKANAWELLGRAVDEPTAFETVEPGKPLNVAQARGGR